LSGVGPGEAFEALTRLLPDAAVFVVDGERRILHWSDGAERLLGFARGDVLGRLCLNAIRCRNCMLGCGVAKHGAVDGFPQQLYRADESWAPIRKYARAFYDEAGEFAGGVEVLVPDGDAVAEPREPEPDLPGEGEVFHGLASRDSAMRRIFQTIRNLAETDATILLRGERGTGKELVARAIHSESQRRNGPFVAVDCAALTEALAESELFGHRRGAFTGATSQRVGLFEQAGGGTLLLDDIAKLPLSVQGRLLRVLEAQRLTPVGADAEVAVDVRIVAAAHEGLRQEVRSGAFREDLMLRLRAVPLLLPPLRERREDVGFLMLRFLDQSNGRGPRRVTRIAPDAMRVLLDHSWPGNVQELRSVVEYAFAVGSGPELALDELPPELSAPVAQAAPVVALRAPKGADEKARIERALEASGGRVSQAAAALGMSRPTFWRKRKKYGLT
jgi:DNA-binding NtrC family response regulator